MSKFRRRLVTAGVKNLRVSGYERCNEKNILIDKVYKEFFKRIVSRTLKQARSVKKEKIVQECRILLRELDDQA